MQQMLILLLFGAVLSEHVRGELVCPLASGHPKKHQIVSKPCAPIYHSGKCDANRACETELFGGDGTSKHILCPTTEACVREGDACACAPLMRCERRVGKHTFVYADCVDAEDVNRKRQELLDEVFDEDTDATPSDNTLAFAAILGLSYLILACIACIYTRPVY